ncbi:hypothetical protein AAF712_006985 [Marasmius tenuissimus]|uniref:Uncharacterized protein n=1 Tax=Marasmius tenuissimus TaxID=585030 RepID=A0ABR2ZWM9_9AGAR
MKFSTLFFAVSSALATATTVFAQAAPPAPPVLKHLYTLNCTLDTPVDVGPGPKGHRVVLPIIGGTFAGKHMTGTVMNLGADWGIADSFGTFSADTRYNLVTDDGANIFIQTAGPGQTPDGVAGTLWHLRISFETGSEKYYWLNNIVAVGLLRPGNAALNYVIIDAFYMDGPAAQAAIGE